MRVRSVLVLTVVHHPDDSRVRHRQIAALLDAGWRVTYAAPWSGYGLEPPTDVPGLDPVDVPRARGRHRTAALRGARELLRSRAGGHDLVLLHDPELLLATPGLDLPPVVWDVHEDTAAAVEVRPWIPGPLRRPAAAAVRSVERLAERRVHLLLADHHYTQRFRRPHPVVPNVVSVPDRPQPAAQVQDGVLRVVYLGSNTLERGAAEMVQVARALPDGVRLEVIGPAHGSADGLLREAADHGVLDWLGFLPADEAVRRLDGALAGLCLLHDQANFRPSMATKVVEYLGRGVPAVVTPLPVQQDLVRRSGAGAVVPFEATTEVVDVLAGWAADPDQARELGLRGHRYVAEHHDWERLKTDFVTALDTIAGTGR
ncbi:glycosyltransferase family protein [Ornithinimicrobium sufpigmenti]|uniref:glycosyltransferase family protein n=1 Tax=Ornithinimicrobium sufpigmenti TaxID=2508882 RepID=UPI00103669F0|nr:MULTISPECIES: glycosyltransferase [unclassified Ornithinimicrobium]